jgi:ketosteroid isomerase-like protein
VSRKNIEVIQRMNAAFNAGDYDALEGLLDPNVEMVDHLPLPDVAQTVRGPGEVRAVLDAWQRGFTGFEGHVEEYVDVGEFVVCTTKWRFVSREEGIEIKWDGAEAWQLRDGKVIWGHVGLRDKAAALEAVGLRE